MPTRILLIDDEPTISEMLGRVLREAGYEVDGVTDPGRVIELVQQARYALVITNSMMQSAGGARLVAQLRAWRPRLPILHLDDQSQARPPEFPADVAVLTKPFHHDLLLTTVRTLVGHTGRSVDREVPSS